MSESYILAGEGAIWIQPNGPNTEPKYLGCHEIGDVDEPIGDIKLMYCPDPSQPNKWQVVGSVQGNPGPIGTSMLTYLKNTIDYMELVRCPVPVYIHHVGCGRMDVFDSFDRTFLLKNTYITGRKLSKLTTRSPENQDRAEQGFELKAEEMLRLFGLKVTKLPYVDTEDVTSIGICDSDQCEGDCGSSNAAGTTVYFGTNTKAGSPINKADVTKTADGGSIFTTLSSAPFSSAEKIAAVDCFQLDRDTTRIIVVRGTTDPANPMEIAYSDDGGLTWTLVNVGSVNGQYAVGPKSLFVASQYDIWLAVTDGYVYHSADGGASWTAQTSGNLTTEDFTSVMFYGEYGFAAGANNAIVKSIDGGDLWSVVTGPTGQAADQINTLWVHDKNHVWLGFNDGTIWFTKDGGTTWTQRTGWTGSGTGSVTDMAWYDEFVGIIVHNTAAPVGTVLSTVNGGYTFTAVTTPTNAGLFAAAAVTPRLFYVAGNAYGGTGIVMKITGG